MNGQIANYIVSLIDTGLWIDKIAAVVVPLAIRNEGEPEKKYPVACGAQHRECNVGKYTDLLPKSKYKSVVFFEDQGATFGVTRRDLMDMTSRLRMIVWLNLQKLGETSCNNSAAVIQDIIRHLPQFPQDNGDFLRLDIKLASEAVKSREIFGRYTLDEPVLQYLIYPYDYFALDFNCKWVMNITCLDAYTPKSPIVCPKQPA